VLPARPGRLLLLPRYCWVVRPADSAEEQPDDLIPHDCVDDAVMGNDRIRCQSIEPVEEGVKVGRAHSFPDACRAADIGEQQGDRGSLPPSFDVCEASLCISRTELDFLGIA
jgi:hypothetical protein